MKLPLLIFFFGTITSSTSAQCLEFELNEQSKKLTGHLLCSHLGHQVKRSKASIKEVVSVAAHLDGIQPVAHSGERGIVRHTAVEERLGGPTEKERSGDKKRAKERGLGHARPPPTKPHPQTPQHHYLSWPVEPKPATVAYLLETCRGPLEITAMVLWVWVCIRKQMSGLKMYLYLACYLNSMYAILH